MAVDIGALTIAVDIGRRCAPAKNKQWTGTEDDRIVSARCRAGLGAELMVYGPRSQSGMAIGA